jgi:putative FmdB family regulatory protein
MPTYRYRCKSCHHEFEELQRISESPLIECPACKKQSLVKIFAGGGGLVFKGSGFYKTDYKKSSRGESSPTTSGSNSGSKKETPTPDASKKSSDTAKPSKSSE